MRNERRGMLGYWRVWCVGLRDVGRYESRKRVWQCMVVDVRLPTLYSQGHHPLSVLRAVFQCEVQPLRGSLRLTPSKSSLAGERGCWKKSKLMRLSYPGGPWEECSVCARWRCFVDVVYVLSVAMLSGVFRLISVLTNMLLNVWCLLVLSLWYIADCRTEPSPVHHQ